MSPQHSWTTLLIQSQFLSILSLYMLILWPVCGGSKGGKALPQPSSLTSGEAHDVEDAVQLVVVVGVTGLDVLLATVEDGLRCQQLGKDAANSPDV